MSGLCGWHGCHEICVNREASGGVIKPGGARSVYIFELPIRDGRENVLLILSSVWEIFQGGHSTLSALVAELSSFVQTSVSGHKSISVYRNLTALRLDPFAVRSATTSPNE